MSGHAGTYPDGREVTAETARLRAATRALRLHLDELPVDHALDVAPDRYLTGVAFMFARQRYDCADSMLGAGFGGTVVGSLARSLFVDGLRWLWIADQPTRQRHLLGDLLAERNRLCVLIEETRTTCPVIPRWLMPLPDIADLTGESHTWLDAPTTPSEDDLLNDFFDRVDAAAPSTSSPVDHSAVHLHVAPLLDMAGLRGAMMVLAHAGHGNYLGLQSSLADDGAAGHDLRADHEALFMQAAAAGVTATLLGVTAATPGSWPRDVDRDPFLSRAITLAADVTSAALPIHRLGAKRHPVVAKRKTSSQRSPNLPLRSKAILTADELLPDLSSADAVVQAAENFYQSAQSFMIRPWDYGQPSLHAMLSYGGGHSGLMTVMSTYDRRGSEVVAVFAGRALLEEAARLNWRFAGPEEAFENRAKQYFDEFRARRKKTVNSLIRLGVSRTDAEQIFAMPQTVQVVTPPDEIAKGRTALPTVSSMLREMGEPFPEPGWLEVAYSLLSQITHSTPIGHLHTVRFRDGGWHGNELSPEMLSLALDTACLGSAHLIGTSIAVLTDSSAEALRHRQRLLREAAAVHNAARSVHGLD